MKSRKSFFILATIFILANTISFSQSLTVKKVTSNVAIDGQLNESFWDLTNQVSIDLYGSNNTANFGVLWDDNYLYVGINVVDENLQTNGRQGFYDDGVEVYIDGNYSKGSTFDEYDRLFVKPIKSYWIQEAEDRYEGVSHQWIETPNGYSMEFAIPWSNFSISPAIGNNIGFNIVVNDDDIPPPNKSVTQLLWNGNTDYYKTPSTWGTIILSSQTVSYSGNYLAVISPNGGNFCINGKITEIEWVSNGINNIDIEYSINNGSSWNSVATNISASSESYSWDVYATPSDQCLIKISDANNSSLNDISESQFTISKVLTAVEPLIPNIWKNYEWPYNAYFPEDPNGINGRVGSACGHASLARILHYWEFPIVGNDELTFTDNGGHIWSANFGTTTYNYDNMPNYLPYNSTEAEYTDVATLTYHAATSMHDIWGSGGDLDNMSYAMSHYFNFKESTPALKSDYTRAEWIQLIINELDNGRVLLVQGMTTEVLGNWHENNSIAGHWYHIDGYNEDGEFHGILGFSDEDGYFDSESLFNYYLNNGVLIGLEPNLNGKELSLQSHNDGEIVNASEGSEILWSSTNVSDIRIEYTIDSGKNWEIITNSTSASSGSYNWTTPSVSADDCKIKLTDVSDINVYDKSNNAFSIKPYALLLSTPNGGNYYIPESSVLISWGSTPISNIKIEYTSNNSISWTEIVASVNASLGPYNWVIPNTISTQCKVRITDVTNAAVFDVSDNVFEIGTPNNLGGPYAVDDNTVLLLHFEGDLSNQSQLSDNAVLQGTGISYSSETPSTPGECLNHDGSSYITIPHNDNLNLKGDWTIEAWIKLEEYRGYPNDPYILRKPGDTDDYWANYAIGVVEAWGNIFHGFYYPEGNNRTNVTGMSPDLNQWYHIAFCRDVTNSSLSITVRNENWEIVSLRSNTFTGNEVLLSLQDIRIGENFNGYIDELRISNIVRNFNSAPVLTDIPGQTIFEGNIFTTIQLDNYVTDIDNDDSQIIWSFSGTNELSIEVDANRVATISTPDEDWFGSENITFTAKDPSNISSSKSTNFIVLPVNDTPIINEAPELIEFISDTSFTIDIWELVSDIETSNDLLIYGFSVDSDSILFSYNDGTGILTLSAEIKFGGEGDLIWSVSDSEANAVDTIHISVERAIIIGINDDMIIPDEYVLHQNYPNPFNPSTMVKYGLKSACNVQLTLYNMLGQKVITLINEYQQAGNYRVKFDASNLSAGTYIYKISAGEFVSVKKLLLLK